MAYYDSNGNSSLFNAYVDEFYDSSADNWKLKFYEDGTASLISDGRPSLYIDDVNNGGEFKLWDLDSYSEQSAMEMITGQLWYKGASSLSIETMKRLGMYAILNANGLFSDKIGKLNAYTFNQLANNSTYTEGLGYYLDFNSIGFELRGKINGVTLDVPFKNNFDWSKDSHNIPWRPFTGDAVKDFFVFGIAEQVGLHINTGQPNGMQYRVETEDGARDVGFKLLNKDNSNQPLVIGIKDSQFMRPEQEKRYDISIPGFSESLDKVSTASGVLVMVGQFSVGAANSLMKDNARVSTWDNDFGKFYTIETASSIKNFSNSTIDYTFTFMSPTDKYFSKYVKQAQKQKW